MKKIFVALLVLVLAVGSSFAADAKKSAQPSSKPVVASGDFLVNVGIGYGGLAAGAEFEFAQTQAGPVSLTFGAGARGAIDPFFSTYGMPWAVGGFAMGHVGLTGLDLPPGLEWIAKTDTYIGLGIGFAGIMENSTYDYWDWKPGIGFSFIVGESYYFNDKFALFGEYGYIGRYRYEYTDPWFGTLSASFPMYYAAVGAIFKL
jgi:hypothetical protein